MSFRVSGLPLHWLGHFMIQVSTLHIGAGLVSEVTQQRNLKNHRSTTTISASCAEVTCRDDVYR